MATLCDCAAAGIAQRETPSALNMHRVVRRMTPPVPELGGEPAPSSYNRWTGAILPARMKSKGMLAIALCLLGSTYLVGQDQAPPLPPAPANRPAPSLSAPDDPGHAALIATCKNPPPARGGRGAVAGRGALPPGQKNYTVTDIPGVIAAGQQWKFLWQEAGNNGDGIVGTDEGGLLIAQNDNSTVVKLDTNGTPSVVYSDTHTGGSLSMSSRGALFIVARGLRTAIVQIAPRRTILADRYQGDVLDCLGGNPNDLTAARNGGVYFTQGGVYYANPKGVVTRYGENVTPNGIILSADEKTLYVTNGPTLAAFDVQPDGSLTDQREFARLEAAATATAAPSTQPGASTSPPTRASR